MTSFVFIITDIIITVSIKCENTPCCIRLQCFYFQNRFYFNATLNWNEDHWLLPYFINHVCTMVNCLYQHFPHIKIMPMFVILGSICLSCLSDRAAVTVAAAVASTSSWKWRTMMLSKQYIHGVLHRLFPLYKYETYIVKKSQLAT